MFVCFGLEISCAVGRRDCDACSTSSDGIAESVVQIGDLSTDAIGTLQQDLDVRSAFYLNQLLWCIPLADGRDVDIESGVWHIAQDDFSGRICHQDMIIQVYELIVVGFVCCVYNSVSVDVLENCDSEIRTSEPVDS